MAIKIFSNGEAVDLAPIPAKGHTTESLQALASEFMAKVESRLAAESAKLAELDVEVAELDTTLAPVLDKEFEIKDGAHVEVVKEAAPVEPPAEIIP